MAKVVGLIRGKKGTVIRLTVIPTGQTEADARVVSLARGDVKLLDLFGDGKLLPPGTVAPNFRFTRIADGKEGDISQYRGRVLVLNAWSSWCKSCVEHMTTLESLIEKYPGWNGTVEFLAVSVDDKIEDAAKCYKANQWTRVAVVWTGPSFFKAYHIGSLPTTYIIDRNGKVAALDPSSSLSGALKNLLAGDRK
jgi:thiol-disulfide isomerase/thioredoxin